MLSPRTTCSPPSTTWSTPDCVRRQARSVWFSAATACVPAQHSAHLARVDALMALVQDQVGRLVVAAQDPLRACLLVEQSR